MINLSAHEAAIGAMIEEGVLAFSSQYPDIAWCTLGIDSNPIYGPVALSFNTQQRSDFSVRTRGKSATFYAKGIDHIGAFANNCVDFAYPSWREHDTSDWESAYDHWGTIDEKPLQILEPNGKITFISKSSGDEAINEIVFRFLRQILKSKQDFIAQHGHNRESIARIGVQMCDSDFVEFWLLDT